MYCFIGANSGSKLKANGIAQTGSYKTEADSTKPLVIDSPTGGQAFAYLSFRFRRKPPCMYIIYLTYTKVLTVARFA